MIQRYTHPDMGRIWSDQRRYETWLQVEVAAVEAMARAGIAPPEAARDIREKGAFSVARIEEIEAVTRYAHEQGLVSRKLSVEELFPASTIEVSRI